MARTRRGGLPVPHKSLYDGRLGTLNTATASLLLVVMGVWMVQVASFFHTLMQSLGALFSWFACVALSEVEAKAEALSFSCLGSATNELRGQRYEVFVFATLLLGVGVGFATSALTAFAFLGWPGRATLATLGLLLDLGAQLLQLFVALLSFLLLPGLFGLLTLVLPLSLGLVGLLGASFGGLMY